MELRPLLFHSHLQLSQAMGDDDEDRVYTQGFGTISQDITHTKRQVFANCSCMAKSKSGKGNFLPACVERQNYVPRKAELLGFPTTPRYNLLS